jgi:hypothetical protein
VKVYDGYNCRKTYHLDSDDEFDDSNEESMKFKYQLKLLFHFSFISKIPYLNAMTCIAKKRLHGHGCMLGEEIDVHVHLGVRVVSPLSWDPMQSPIEFNAQPHHGSA